MAGIIDALVGISQFLPEIKKPEKEVTFKNKLLWTLIALLIFFVLANIRLLGLDTMSQSVQQIMFAQTLLASEMGTLITAGIGPIVMASIFLQLFSGAKLIKLDLGSQEGRAKFQQLQKLLAIILCFVEGFIYVASGLLAPMNGFLGIPSFGWTILLTLQIAIGSLILLYLDEIVSKYGIGSGVSLFIAAGVTGALFWSVFLPPIDSITNPALATGGMLWRTFTTGDPTLLLPVVGVIAIFLVVVFAEGMHVNIPITMGHRGTGGRYPVKFLYVSNMPVILAMALFMNVRLWALFVAKVPILGQLMDGLSWAVQIPNIGGLSLFHGLILQGLTQSTLISIAQAVIFLVLLIIACIVFGWFWVQMGNQSTQAVAGQLERAGMQIPGFRRDKRVIEKVLERYIPPITILGSIFVALLSGLGDFVLAGVTSGTGILLTVGIIYRFYEEIAKTQQEFLSKIVGNLA
ncbi:MAG: preprotein translocase subunit SecY [Candidatus Diapherotrites archaeon]|nr:preprotein translocase subunit SecY [Candidatus Diapherotrites archaeon]